MAGRKQKTREQLIEDARKIQARIDALEALENLPKHKAVKALNTSVAEAVKETGADEIFVRIAELKISNVDLVEFYRELKGAVDEWAENHATYRNPENDKEFWYSPDGKGNPPDWIKREVGEKPKTKKASDLGAWLEKAEKFKVKAASAKKAA